MTHQQDVINLIKTTCGQANVLAIPRLFVDFVGSLDGALLLSQIVYWSDRGQDPHGWFYKSYAEWQAEICLSEYQVRKGAKKLVKLGILETRVKKAPDGNPTVHYRLDWANFLETLRHFLEERYPTCGGNEAPASAETLNTETTSKITDKKETALSLKKQAGATERGQNEARYGQGKRGPKNHSLSAEQRQKFGVS